MKSIYILAEAGLPLMTITKLYEDGIKYVDDINPEVIRKCFGFETVFRKHEINKAVYRVRNVDRSNSIYDLIRYGLSLDIINQLFISGVTLDDIENDSFINKCSLTTIDISMIKNSYSIYKEDFNDENDSVKILSEVDLNEKHSVFMLAEYGFPLRIISRIFDEGIKYIEQINSDVVNDLFGEYSITKKREIRKAMSEVALIRRKYSIFDLINYDLSLNLINKLYEENVTLYDIETNNFINMVSLSQSSYDKVEMAFYRFLKNTEYEIELNVDVLFSAIKKEFEYKTFTIDELIEKLNKQKYNTNKIEIFLSELLDDNKIIINDDSLYCIVPPKISEVLETIEDDRRADILKSKFSGMTLEAIGQKYGVSRERVRQILVKTLKKFPPVQELVYKDIFETYNFTKDIFCEVFNVDEYAYYFLKEKYKIGTVDPMELLDTDLLTEEQYSNLVEILKDKAHIINLNGENIVGTRNNILISILKKEDRLLSLDEVFNIYNEIIDEYELNYLEKFDINLLTDVRKIDSTLSKSKYIISDTSRTYKYYCIEDIDENDKRYLKSLLNLDAGDYSSELIFNSNKKFMQRINIDNEYQLHNLLRKVIGNNKNVTFSRMPDILIKCNDKIEFIDNLIQEMAPISVEEFVDYVYTNYGHKTNTFRSLLLQNFSHYIDNNYISFDSPEFTSEQINELSSILTDDIYSIQTVKQILTDLYDVDNFKLINNRNMQKIGYRVRGNYIMKVEINNLEGYMRNIILNSDYYDILPEYRKIGSTFSSYLYNFIYNGDLFKISDDKYITMKKLNTLGIFKEDIENFINEVNNQVLVDQYFNLYMLNLDNCIEKFKNCNFPDCFYETIISSIPDVKSFSLKNNIIFIKSKDLPTREKFINSYIINDKTKITDIKNDIYSSFNIEVSEYYIREFINKKKYYYHASSDIVYKSKEIFENEIDDFDILKYID